MQNIQKGKSDCIKHFTKSVSSIYNKCYSNSILYLTKRLMKIDKTNIYTCVKDKSKKNKCHEPTHVGNSIICHFNFVILKGFNGLIVRFWNFLSCNRFMENSYSIIKNCIYFKQHTLFKKWILVKMAGNVHRGKKKKRLQHWGGRDIAYPYCGYINTLVPLWKSTTLGWLQLCYWHNWQLTI